MRIGFDLRPALKKNSRRRGIGKYTRQLLEALVVQNPDHSFILYSRAGGTAEVPSRCTVRNVPHLARPGRLNWVPDLLFLPLYLHSDGVEIFHATDITSIPRSSKVRVWATVHDLIPFIYWEETVRGVPRDFVWALKLAWKRMAQADLILTDSLYSRSDICERLGVPEERVHVVYPGATEGMGPVDPEEARNALREQYRISGPFVFYVGGSDFRKNLPRLVQSFGRVRKKGYPGKLILGGETFTWEIPEVVELRARIEALNLGEHVVFCGFIPECHLPFFYSACDAFVFPSLYEGFGLPVLEALQCGAPVLTSHTSSLPEVAGEAAVLVDPEDEESIVNGFWEIFSENRRRHEMRETGFRQARRFSWKQAARQIRQLYEAYGR